MSAEPTYNYNMQDIERYLNGKMTAQEMHDIEKAALGDPLLADAIDGYRHADPLLTAKHLNEITALLQNKENGEAVVVPIASGSKSWKRWVAAAGVAGMMGIGAWLLMNSDNKQEENIAKLSVPAATDSNNISEKQTNTPSLPTADSTPNLLADAPKPAASEAEIKKTSPAEPKAAKAIPPAEIKTDAATPVSTDALAFSESKVAGLEIQSAPASQKAIAQNRQAAQIIMPGLRKSEVSYANQSVQPAPIAGFTKALFEGKITDDKGNPLSGASVAAGNTGTVSKADGSFTLALPGMNDSVGNVLISSVGYNSENTTLFAGRMAGIALQPRENPMNEVVVVGFGSKKKAQLGRISELKPEPMQTLDGPFPEGGWASFYDDLLEELGVNKEKANKLLHLKFFIEDDGKPANFTVIKTPDMAVADRAIAAIKNGPRWRNFAKGKNAEIKMNVE